MNCEPISCIISLTIVSMVDVLVYVFTVTAVQPRKLDPIMPKCIGVGAVLYSCMLYVIIITYRSQCKWGFRMQQYVSCTGNPESLNPRRELGLSSF